MPLIRDPVRAIINASSVSVTVIDTTVAGYDPTSTDDYVPGETDVSTTVKANFEFDAEKDIIASYGGSLLIAAGDIPQRPVAAKTLIQIGSITYNVISCRDRYWKGKVNGYTLVLSK